MMEFIRENFNRWAAMSIIGVICLAFVFVGVWPSINTSLSLGGATVAKVGSEEISLMDVEREVENQMQFYRSMGDKLPPNFSQQIRQGVIQSQIQRKLLLLEAKHMGIGASSEEVMEQIKQQSVFQDKATKAFNVDTYRRVLQANHLQPGQYEDMIREDLIRNKLQDLIRTRLRITDEEVKREFRLSEDKRKIEFLRFSKESAFPKLKVSAPEIDAYLKDPEKLNLVHGYYDRNLSKYKHDEEVCARHILKRGGEKDKNPPKAFTILKPTAANFAELAKKESEDPGSKSQGGDLGCFAKGAMDKAFETVAFSTPIGHISKPVQSQFGWHYIYVYKKNAPLNIPFEKVQRTLAEEIIKGDRIDEIHAINKKAAEQALAAWKTQGLSSALKTSGTTLEDTGLFTRLENSIPKIGRAPEIMDAAFQEDAKIQTEPVSFESHGTILVAKVNGKQAPDFSKFDTEKDTLLKTLQERKLRAILPAWSKHMQEEFKITVNEKVLASLQ